MAYSIEEIYETVKMTVYYNFDIRTVTLGINLKDCIDSDLGRFKENVYEKITTYAKKLVKEAEFLEKKYGVPITNKRISVTPVSLIVESVKEKDGLLQIAQTLDKAAKESGIDFIGGYGALVQKGMTNADEKLIDSLPEVLSKTERVCAFLNVASTRAGMNMDAIIRTGQTIKSVSQKTDGSGCARLVVFANAPEDNPFMAGAYHGVGEPDFSLNIGISGPGVVRSVVEKNRECDLTELSEIIKKTTFKITRAGELIGRELAERIGVPFGIVDVSLASTTAAGDSVARIIEGMGIEVVGAHGTTAALALLIDAVKKGGTMASGNVGGLSGTFIPVTEDSGMAEAVKKGALSLDKLEAMTAVCSVGLDMFTVPGDIEPEKISAIIADELAIGIVNNKTTGVRIIPVPGKKAGDWVDFGGLLGGGPVMAVNKYSAKDFIRRGGRFPSTITSMRN
ncbi:MAG: PFL family protein [Candidatus Altiarchaeota archaeon]|nr:PFL family protein [Candidatus Altiarchaeota archaeon]